MKSLFDAWIQAKEDERHAIEVRRNLEDMLTKELGVPEAFDKSTTWEVDGYKINVTGRIDRKVDADMVQAIANEHGVADHLQSLFRWKAEINQKAWKSVDQSLTDIFIPAITSKAGRPSYKIERIEK